MDVNAQPKLQHGFTHWSGVSGGVSIDVLELLAEHPPQKVETGEGMGVRIDRVRKARPSRCW